MKRFNAVVIALCIVLSAIFIGRAYTYKYRVQDTIEVTGLGETDFTSDLIVWRGWITAEAGDVASGYARIESSRKKVLDYIVSKGIPADSVVFMFVNVNKATEPVYSSDGAAFRGIRPASGVYGRVDRCRGRRGDFARNLVTDRPGGIDGVVGAGLLLHEARRR